MKCPKCDYLGFETGDRCRNCGYDFSLLAAREPLPDARRSPDEDDLDLHTVDVPAAAPGPEVWLDRLDETLPAIDAPTRAIPSDLDDFLDISFGDPPRPAASAPVADQRAATGAQELLELASAGFDLARSDHSPAPRALGTAARR